MKTFSRGKRCFMNMWLPKPIHTKQKTIQRSDTIKLHWFIRYKEIFQWDWNWRFNENRFFQFFLKVKLFVSNTGHFLNSTANFQSIHVHLNHLLDRNKALDCKKLFFFQGWKINFFLFLTHEKFLICSVTFSSATNMVHQGPQITSSRYPVFQRIVKSKAFLRN